LARKTDSPPVLSVYGPVIVVDLPALILYVESAPAQQVFAAKVRYLEMRSWLRTGP